MSVALATEFFLPGHLHCPSISFHSTRREREDGLMSVGISPLIATWSAIHIEKGWGGGGGGGGKSGGGIAVYGCLPSAVFH